MNTVLKVPLYMRGKRPKEAAGGGNGH
jgi:hypothetical protein